MLYVVLLHRESRLVSSLLADIRKPGEETEAGGSGRPLRALFLSDIGGMGNGLASGGGFLLLARDLLFVDNFMNHERPMHNADVLMFALQHHFLDVGYR